MGTRGRKNLTEENCFFITTTIVDKINIFRSDNCSYLLLKSIRFYKNKYKFRIYAYVIMPSHFHWIIRTKNELGTCSDIMRDIKKFSAWDILAELERNKNVDYLKIFEKAAIKYNNQKRKVWQERFDDVIIRSRKFMLQKMHYIHNNPVKAGLVEKAGDYKYSSARSYMKSDHSIIKIDMDWM